MKTTMMMTVVLAGAILAPGVRAAADFEDARFSPAYFWMWNDKLDEAKLIAQLDDMHAHGLRSVCVHPFPKLFRPGIFESHMEPGYLTPEYLAVFSKVAARTQALGMDFWLYDEGGWPSDDLVIRPVDEKPVSVALGDWRETFGGAFSGKAVYRIEFESEESREAVLDLGRVCWCAGVRLNGKDAGSRFFGPFRWEVPLAKGRNVLEVTVANLLSTHLGDPEVRAKIKTAHKPHPLYEKYHGEADRQNRESGLFGPVVLRR